METSNSPEPVVDTVESVASAPETSAPEVSTAPSEGPQKPETLKDVIAKQGQKPLTASAKDQAQGEQEPTKEPAIVPDVSGQAPVYEPNFKFKAFGKEKEIPEMFRGLIKDADSEKQVREVFTKSEAFDDMKQRYEGTAQEFQGLLNEHKALDQDVKRVMKFRNSRDFDNFFQSLRISDQEVFQWAQQKIQALQDPTMHQQYQQAAQQRAQVLQQQEEYESLQSNYQSQAVQARTMQLDMVMARPDVTSTASAYDSRVGQIGAFRDLVIEEAKKAWFVQKVDLSAEQATQVVLQKFGKLFEQTPQANAQAPAQQAQAPQAQQPVVVAPKPTIPSVQGKGTSPIKQAPKSLDDIRKMAKAAQKAEYHY